MFVEDSSMRKNPVFIVGAQRSGTTLLRLMLDSHSQIAIPFETDFILPYYSRLNDFGALNRTENARKLVDLILENRFVRRGEMSVLTTDEILSNLKDRTYSGVVAAVFETWARRRQKSRWGDKNPGAPQLSLLDRLFPDAVFLHIIRDGRDVAASRMHVRGWTQRSVIQLAHHWCWMVSTVRHAGRTLGNRYKEITYEALVTAPEATLRDVCDWLGEQYEPAMLGYHKTAISRMPEDAISNHKSSVSELDESKIGMSRRLMSAGDRAVFQSVAGVILKDLGYRLERDTGLRFRVALKLSEISHAVRGLSVFPYPGLDYWVE